MAAGENPEYTMEYILDVLGQIQSQCVALMDDIRTGKDAPTACQGLPSWAGGSD